MQDPHVDIAMFCIYAMYDKAQTDHLIDIYFQGQCPDDIRTKSIAIWRLVDCSGQTGVNIKASWG